MSSGTSMSLTAAEEREEGHAAAATHRQHDADTAAAWAFYESGLVQDTTDGGANDDEDTEDELETADWIRFQRARAQSRLRAARQQQQQQHLLQSPASAPDVTQANALADSP